MNIKNLEVKMLVLDFERSVLSVVSKPGIFGIKYSKIKKILKEFKVNFEHYKNNGLISYEEEIYLIDRFEKFMNNNVVSK